MYLSLKLGGNNNLKKIMYYFIYEIRNLSFFAPPDINFNYVKSDMKPRMQVEYKKKIQIQT